MSKHGFTIVHRDTDKARVKRRNIISTVLFLLLSVCAGVLMTACGYSTENGYFWQRQLVIWLIFPVAPGLIYLAGRKK